MQIQDLPLLLRLPPPARDWTAFGNTSKLVDLLFQFWNNLASSSIPSILAMVKDFLEGVSLSDTSSTRLPLSLRERLTGVDGVPDGVSLLFLSPRDNLLDLGDCEMLGVISFNLTTNLLVREGVEVAASAIESVYLLVLLGVVQMVEVPVPLPTTPLALLLVVTVVPSLPPPSSSFLAFSLCRVEVSLALQLRFLVTTMPGFTTVVWWRASTLHKSWLGGTGLDVGLEEFPVILCCHFVDGTVTVSTDTLFQHLSRALN
ncbi:hypothetical protein E2C01_003415 [Portunus trituberculatus]|uniref:Uncharacterized protein n=1 Tax=Portunus trituberculatus TaxID=210409 RepID=A0A5B7CQ37_PORTR|nr:hypothetical protein [Portunus trituberculatus]